MKRSTILVVLLIVFLAGLLAAVLSHRTPSNNWLRSIEFGASVATLLGLLVYVYFTYELARAQQTQLERQARMFEFEHRPIVSLSLQPSSSDPAPFCLYLINHTDYYTYVYLEGSATYGERPFQPFRELTNREILIGPSERPQFHIGMDDLRGWLESSGLTLPDAAHREKFVLDLRIRYKRDGDDSADFITSPQFTYIHTREERWHLHHPLAGR